VALQSEQVCSDAHLSSAQIVPKGFFRKSRNNDMISVITLNGCEELLPQCRPAAPKKTFSTKKHTLQGINRKRLAAEVLTCMNALLKWYKKNQETMYPLELAFKFHAQFEKIHPFCDGNGRVGRLLINYILLKKGYFPIIIRKTLRNQYIKALEAADRKKWVPIMRFAIKNYKRTFRQFFEVYYKHIQVTATPK
jgi:Fic family protein